MINIDGAWDVKVTHGPRWFRLLNLIRDRKYIDSDCGINAAGIVGEWGVFRVEKTGRLTFTLTYLDSPIVDKVWIVSHELLLGKFYWKDRLVGDFKMEKVGCGK